MSKRISRSLVGSRRGATFRYKPSTPSKLFNKRAPDGEEDTVIVNDLCKTCNAILTDRSDTSHSVIQSGPHHETLLHIERAAQAACHVCVSILDKLVLEGHGKASVVELEKPATSYAISRNFSSDRLHFAIHIHSNGAYIPVSFSMIPLDVDHPVKTEFRAECLQKIYTRADAGLAKSTSAPSVLALALNWLETCMDYHNECAPKDLSSTWEPARLIDLSGARPRLLDTSVQRCHSPYATLSHCWGPKTDFLKLTATNVQGLQTEIPLSQLPQNFRDAMVITKALRLHFLWIDCLCILQEGPGSEEDWNKHAVTMRSIYTNGVVNIAADRASHARDGIFTNRDPRLVEPCVVRWNPRSSYPLSCLLVDDRLIEKSLQLTPLALRAWVVQERLLARRTLHFGSRQIFWECHEMPNACETFPDGIPCYLQDHRSAYFALPTIITHDPIPLQLSQDQMPNVNIRLWNNIVENYTKCQLTYPTKDKFMAVAGIAPRFFDISDAKEANVAGFFRSSLPRALLWRCSSTNPGTTSAVKPSKEPQHYRAPSWSWACTDVAVTTFTSHDPYHKDIAEVINDPKICLIDPTNPFGQLRYAEIQLRAPCAAVRWDVEPTPFPSSSSSVPTLHIKSHSYDRRNSFLALDQDYNLHTDQMNLVFLAIAVKDVSKFGAVSWMYGLVIKSSTSISGEQKYKRLGYLAIEARGGVQPFPDMDEREFTLV